MGDKLNNLLEIEQDDTTSRTSGTVVYLLLLPVILTLSYWGSIVLLAHFGIFVHNADIVLPLGGLCSFIAAGISSIYGLVKGNSLSARQKTIIFVQTLLFMLILAWFAFLAFVLFTSKSLFNKM